AARVGTSGVRRMALERVLGAAGVGDRVQARSLSTRTERAESLRRPFARRAPVAKGARSEGQRRCGQGAGKYRQRLSADGPGRASPIVSMGVGTRACALTRFLAQI